MHYLGIIFIVLPLLIAGVILYRDTTKEISTHAVSKEKTTALLNQILMILSTLGALIALPSVPVVGPVLQTLYESLGLIMTDFDPLWGAIMVIIDVAMAIWTNIKNRFFTNPGAAVRAYSLWSKAQTSAHRAGKRDQETIDQIIYLADGE